MMRHGSRPFVVEVKRGQKRTPVVHTVEPSAPPPLPPETNSLDDIFRRAEAALFERAPEQSEKATPQADTLAAPQRRILETLTEVDPLVTLLAERGEGSRRGRKPGSKNKPKDVAAQDAEKTAAANKNGSVELTPERINEALKAMERATGVYSPRRTSPSPPKPSYQSASVPHAAPRGAAPHMTPTPIVVAAAIAPAGSLGVRAATAAEPSADPTTLIEANDAVDEARSRDRGSIRKRYVTGTEPRPGERWKRRLRGIL